MESGTSLCLIVCFLVCSSEAQKNIRPEKIKAVLGQDVILPCKVPNNINIIAVVWSRLHEDPEYVLFYRDGHSVPHNQNPSYQNRVDLNKEKMKDGDVSLILKNVTKNDNGTYKCLVFEEGKVDPISIINLEVHPPAQTNIPAEPGQDVILPCKVPINNNIKAVEWTRPDQEPEYVLFYRDGYFDPENQHPSYQNRVDLNEEKMKDGDFSLVLKNVMKNDTGRYECWVLQMEPHRSKRSNLDHEPISTTYLEVRPPGVKDGGNMVGFTGGHLGVVGVILLHIVVSIVFPGD